MEQVDPENTSWRCLYRGFAHPDNREGEDFACLKYGYGNHADYNAAKNTGLRYLRRTQTGSSGGAPVGVHLNNGTLNANGAYDHPADDPARAGVRAESLRLQPWGSSLRAEVSRGIGHHTSQLALNSGALNLNGEYTPAGLLE